MRTGFVNPNVSIDAAIWRICFSEWGRGLRRRRVSDEMARGSTWARSIDIPMLALRSRARRASSSKRVVAGLRREYARTLLDATRIIVYYPSRMEGRPETIDLAVFDWSAPQSRYRWIGARNSRVVDADRVH